MKEERNKRKMADKMSSFVRAFIPRFVPNLWVLAGMDLLKGFGLSKSRIRRNREYNRDLKAEEGSLYRPGQFIENQAEWTGVRFGSKYDMAYSGCEIIATYNALLALGEKLTFEDMVELIGSYERKGAVLKGAFGVAPCAVSRYLKDRGYRVTNTRRKDRNTLVSMGKCSDTMILTVYNDRKDITGQIHTVCVTKDENGEYLLHNAFWRNREGRFESCGPYRTVGEVIKAISHGEAEVIYAMGIGSGTKTIAERQPYGKQSDKAET